MKYLVMECHAGYAILLDEDARFVQAANLHYTVGQTVTDPILMQAGKPSIQMTKIAMRAIAAAACVALVSTVGLKLYRSRTKTETVVMICAEAKYEMQLNSRGEVISLNSADQTGQAVLAGYDGLHKNKETVADELMRLQMEQGNLESGDTVQFYVNGEDGYNAYKADLENAAESLNLHADVQQGTEPPAPPEPKHPEPPAAPEPPPAAPDKPEPPAPSQHTDEQPPAPPAPAEEPAPHEKPGEKHEPPKPDEKPDEKPDTKPDTPPAPPEEPDEHPHPGQPDEPPTPPEPPAPPVPADDGGTAPPTPPEHPEPDAPHLP